MKDINKSIEQTKSKIEEAYHPTPVHKQTLSVTALKKLKNHEEIILAHPHIKGLELKVRKDFKVDTVMNLPTVFYGEKFIISDNGDSVFPQHDVLLNKEEMVAYVERLFTCKTKDLLYYLRSLARKGLIEGNVIEFQDGRKGVIVIPEGDFIGRNPMFVPLKKDGTKSNHKPRYIYANDVYEKVSEQLEEKEK